jgi:hypothetical protein
MTDLTHLAPNNNAAAAPDPTTVLELPAQIQHEHIQQVQGQPDRAHGDQNDPARNGPGPARDREDDPPPALRLWSNDDKHRTPTLLRFFNGLSLKARLQWNKAREDKNEERDLRRIRAREFLPDVIDVSDDDSILSLLPEEYESLCDHDVYSSFSSFFFFFFF